MCDIGEDDCRKLCQTASPGTPPEPTATPIPVTEPQTNTTILEKSLKFPAIRINQHLLFGTNKSKLNKYWLVKI